MRKKAVLITGANGEVGHRLLEALYKRSKTNIITLDINHLNKNRI